MLKEHNRKMKLTAVYVPCEEGGYSAFIEEMPGVNSQGETLKEAKANLIEALNLMLEVHHEMVEAEIKGNSVI